MMCNSDMCYIIHMGPGNKEFEYQMEGVNLATVEEEKDVGVMVHRSQRLWPEPTSLKNCQRRKKSLQIPIPTWGSFVIFKIFETLSGPKQLPLNKCELAGRGVRSFLN